MTVDETSDPEAFGRRARLVGGVLGWAILAVGVVPFALLIIAGLAWAFVVPYLPVSLGSAGVASADDGGGIGDLDGIGATIVLSGAIALGLIAASRTGPAVGRLARPRRRPSAYLLDVAAASLAAFGAGVILLRLGCGFSDIETVGLPADLFVAVTLIREVNFVVAPLAVASGVVWLIERGLGRPLPRTALGVIAGVTLLFCVALRVAIDPLGSGWATAGLAAVQVAAFVFARSAVAIILPQVAVGSSLVLLPGGPGPDVGLATGALVLGLGLAVVARVRPRMTDAEPAA